MMSMMSITDKRLTCDLRTKSAQTFEHFGDGKICFSWCYVTLSVKLKPPFAFRLWHWDVMLCQWPFAGIAYISEAEFVLSCLLPSAVLMALSNSSADPTLAEKAYKTDLYEKSRCIMCHAHLLNLSAKLKSLGSSKKILPLFRDIL